MGLRDVMMVIENDIRQKVCQDTWGHLAPIKDKTYKGRIVYAIGCFNSGRLNPTPLISELESLSSSPWYYSALHDMLGDLPEKFRKDGCVYEWTGTFKNYEFDGKIRLLVDPN